MCVSARVVRSSSASGVRGGARVHTDARVESVTSPPDLTYLRNVSRCCRGLSCQATVWRAGAFAGSSHSSSTEGIDADGVGYCEQAKPKIQRSSHEVLRQRDTRSHASNA